ncbi:hypothetical protein FCT18_21260 [Lysinibacillus sphaericus]|uniref:Uncharacterized protein n=1 Tax=Lysinibacillus sphaericus TaxID=1421 RepID=A0A2S0JX08_LYSSH|nr:hypothetical protein [Lysinibacillus sphaericus]AVK95621.1 hypothetical protein LS41612_04690 [Lysinibacillus sphaericus]MED4546473.1 hypothetical protein [Lysinibacillus sphaericus]TKI16341.1 hypothetical protein FCT18_21260 [Lysinibacillus sphaericus]SUV18664.1 Uncharacterised protein [Lysinibacillus sphaericus]GEC84662.1 hypothetical protein LSP03_44050 [Lysinibacillus sphaericus]
MKIVLNHQIQLQDYRKGYVDIYKDFESDVIPRKGDFIADTCFKDPYQYEVIEVIISYQENECNVSLKPIKVEHNDKDFLLRYVEMSELHNWYCPSKKYL